MAIGLASRLQQPLSVLAFTPTPTHPPIQGNRQRTFDICRAMQSMGAKITLLHYATEGLGAAEAQQMKEVWSDVEVVFPRGFVLRHSLVRYPAIDDWFDEEIGDAARRLAAKRRFDVCVVNYAWYSKIFEYLPAGIVRVIDTHDVFGGRAERFAALDLAPQWFHTSVAQESTGLDRADFVLAIQKVEGEIFRERTKALVQTIGFLSAPNYLPAQRRRPGERMRVGYIGSANPFNVNSLQNFARALKTVPAAALAMDIHIAGPICAALPALQHEFIMHGIVDSIVDFYRSVDVVVNPMLGGTGLKIKSLEALGFGKPLVATLDAMTGIDTGHVGHRLADAESVVRRLLELVEEPARLKIEADISRQTFSTYRQAQLRAFSQFWSLVEQEVDARRSARAIPRTIGAS